MKFEIAAAMDVLSRTPAAVRALLDGIDERFATSNEGGETFSPFDVVGHLIDGEETDWISRAKIILAEEPGATFEPYDRFRHHSRNKGRTLVSLLDEFARLRVENLALMRSWNLDARKLELMANHPALGPVTLSQLLAAWVAHDLGHIAQISRVMAKQYRGEVGPWVAYLPVLTDHDTPRS
jgi:hypothetical protein